MKRRSTTWWRSRAEDGGWQEYTALQAATLESARGAGVSRVFLDASTYVTVLPPEMVEKRIDNPQYECSVRRSEEHDECASQKRSRLAEGDAPALTRLEALDLASRLLDGSRHKLSQHGVSLLPPDAAVVQRYAHARRNLRHEDVCLLGFRQYAGNDAVLSATEAAHILAFCEQEVEWEPRLGNSGRELHGTERKLFGVTMDSSYRPLVGSATPLPPRLEALGERVLRFMKSQSWEMSRSPIGDVSRFDQAYIQKYPPGGSAQASTLGFHFDHRTAYGELICGVTICGSGKLLLAGSNGTDFIDQPERTMRQANVHVSHLEPRSVYAMTGLARYDLRHAVVNDSANVRISITFRAVNWDKARQA
jgi:hypothetical protein